jgi:hypothetical protein
MKRLTDLTERIQSNRREIVTGKWNWRLQSLYYNMYDAAVSVTDGRRQYN